MVCYLVLVILTNKQITILSIVCENIFPFWFTFSVKRLIKNVITRFIKVTRRRFDVDTTLYGRQ